MLRGRGEFRDRGAFRGELRGKFRGRGEFRGRAEFRGRSEFSLCQITKKTISEVRSSCKRLPKNDINHQTIIHQQT